MNTARFTISALVCLGMVFSFSGCAKNCLSRKGQSYFSAIDILSMPEWSNIFDHINSIEDVDTLRIIAFSAKSACWPMEAGSDLEMDNRLEQISLAAMRRLFAINSIKARESIEYYERTFGVDGDEKILFEEWENEANNLRK